MSIPGVDGYMRLSPHIRLPAGFHRVGCDEPGWAERVEPYVERTPDIHPRCLDYWHSHLKRQSVADHLRWLV